MSRIQKRSSSECGLIFDKLDNLKIVVDCIKAEGKRVVLANGTFDLLHVGHIRMLRDAKSRGDYLIVALNSDASVKKYKNPKLPIQSQDQRAEVLVALRFVDYLVIFDEPSADKIIEFLQPDMVAKGTDYTSSSLPEKSTVESYGGTIVICGDAKGDKGSSKMIQKIQKMGPAPAAKKPAVKKASARR